MSPAVTKKVSKKVRKKRKYLKRKVEVNHLFKDETESSSSVSINKFNKW